MEAAFDDSDDDDDMRPSDPRPLNPATTSQYHQVSAHPPTPGSYDFENPDYDYPPPGSPPHPSAQALPNDFGNSNGLIPSFEQRETNVTAQPRSWFRRAANAILPSYYKQRLGLAPRIPTGAIGGGINNDGVFSNVTAKPTRSVRVGEGMSSICIPSHPMILIAV
jgi:hypothetical protein